MKRVFIDNQKGVVVVNGRKIPSLLLGLIRGAVGKSFVVKHYKGGRVVVAKYPDMSGIVPSVRQQERRALFREAVVYARWMVGDEERKKAFRKTLPRKRRKQVYQAAIQRYMSRQGDAGWLRKQLAVRGMMSASAEKQLAVKGIMQISAEKLMHNRVSFEYKIPRKHTSLIELEYLQQIDCFL